MTGHTARWAASEIRIWMTVDLRTASSMSKRVLPGTQPSATARSQSRSPDEPARIRRHEQTLDHGLGAALPAREDAEAAYHGLGQQFDLFPLEAEILADLEIGNAQLHREGAGDVVLGHVAQVAQHLAQRPAGRVRGTDGLLQLGRGDFPGPDQKIA